MTRFGFCNILDNQDLRKCYRLRQLARLIIVTSTLIFPDITKTRLIINGLFNLESVSSPSGDISHPNYSSYQAQENVDV